MGTPLASLLSMLDLEDLGRTQTDGPYQEDVTLFEGPCDDIGNKHMFGGHVMAQAIIAAGRTIDVDNGRHRGLHSIHCYFPRPGDVSVPIRFAVEHVRDGGSFSMRTVHAIQHGERIFTLSASFHDGVGGFDHEDAPPAVAGPEGIATVAERYANEGIVLPPDTSPSPAWGAIESLHVTPDVLLLPAEDRSPDQLSWCRTSGQMPDDPLLHSAVLAYASDLYLLFPGVRRHGLTAADPHLRMATIDHAMWFHRPVRVDDWVLSSLHTPSAQDGRSMSTGQLFQDGRLVASVAQEGMLLRK